MGLEAIIFSGSAGSKGDSGSVQGEEKGPEGSAMRDEAGRRLLMNPQAGLIMAHAEAPILEEAGRFIEAVEGSIQRQVLIEAKIVEVTLNKDSQLGVNWNAVLNPKNYTGLLPDALGVTKPSIGLFTGQSSNPNLDPSKGSFSYGIGNGKVGVILDALANQGKLRVLSNPRISTLNNQKAMIRVVREEVYFTLNSMASQNLGPTITTQNVINQVVPIGVVLDILPQIGNDGEITLSVNPSISELVEVRTFTSANGQAVSTQPVIDRRDLDTVAKVKSGQTILIAGIIRERKGDSMRGVPGLMHMPLLGSAFRRTEVSTARTELVMFITPTLMSGKTIDDLSQQERDNLDQLEKKFDVLKKKGK